MQLVYSMEDFNSQYANHSKLEQLKQFILEHGTYIELKKGEQFTIQGKVNHRGAYIEHGLLRYTRVDEKGNAAFFTEKAKEI